MLMHDEQFEHCMVLAVRSVGLPPKAYVYLHLALVLSPDREAFLPSVPRDTH